MNCVLVYHCVETSAKLQFGSGRRGDLVLASSPKRTFNGNELSSKSSLLRHVNHATARRGPEINPA